MRNRQLTIDDGPRALPCCDLSMAEHAEILDSESGQSSFRMCATSAIGTDTPNVMGVKAKKSGGNQRWWRMY